MRVRPLQRNYVVNIEITSFNEELAKIHAEPQSTYYTAIITLPEGYKRQAFTEYIVHAEYRGNRHLGLSNASSRCGRASANANINDGFGSFFATRRKRLGVGSVPILLENP